MTSRVTIKLSRATRTQENLQAYRLFGLWFTTTFHASTFSLSASQPHLAALPQWNIVLVWSQWDQFKQEVWPPGSADTYLMTQVQNFVSQIKKRQRWNVQMMWAYDLDLGPWRSPQLSVICVLVLSQSSKCKFRSMAHMGQAYHVTLWFSPLTLDVIALACLSTCVGRSTSSIHTTTLKFLGLTVRKIWHILCLS